MTPFDAYLQLITPVAVLLAIASGAAMGLVMARLRPGSEADVVAYFAVVLGVLWYVPQAVSLIATGGTPWATLGRMTVYLLGFVLTMWVVLRMEERRRG